MAPAASTTPSLLAINPRLAVPSLILIPLASWLDLFAAHTVSLSMEDPLASDELLALVLAFVPPADLLRSAARVSRRFADAVSSEAFWRAHPLSPSAQPRPDDCRDNGDASARLLPPLTKHQLQRCCLFIAACREGGEGEDAIKARLGLNSVLTSRTEAEGLRTRLPNERRTCAASSTDHWNELVENVLPNNNNDVGDHGGDDDDDNEQQEPIDDGVRVVEQAAGNVRGPPGPQMLRRLIGIVRNNNFEAATPVPVSWWSSTPSSTRDSSDTLLLTTKYPLALISSVKIKALRDPYMFRDPAVYSWNRTIVRAYRLPLGTLSDPDVPAALAGFPCSFEPAVRTDETSRRMLAAHRPRTDNTPVSPDQTTIDRLLEGATLTGESFFDEPVGDAIVKTLTLSHPVVANVITLTLVGKNNEQRQGLGYYACVERVDCTGIPLYESPDQPEQVREAREALMEA